ncbi:MAG: bifunctional riboflavin kinase/FAD synthetase [Oscillospiraceae bacterium]|nr:bifunctional riboflavin kinase/FAD synthetase [Oscillospiraceae bacterium]
MTNTKQIIALGFFDGVHLGHQALLRECCRLADALGCGTGAITFEKHPQSLFQSTPPMLISTIQDRKQLLKAYGMAHITVLPVTEDVMSTPWERFLERLLELGGAGFVCGGDFRFGHRGEGNAALLAEFCRERGLPCVIVPEQTVDGIRVSSTYIRRQLETGDMATAVKFLGHPHILTGRVVHGKQLGRRLGIPTANLRLPDGLAVPKFGVYACRALVDGAAYPAVTNIGTRPTVEGRGITVEPWILDYSGDLYDWEITLEFHRFLRPERKFDSLDTLKTQIHHDAEETRKLFA